MEGVSESSRPAGSRGALLAGLLAGVVAVAFEAVAVATAMPAAARDLGHVSLYAYAFTLFVIGMVFSTALAGRACDRVGPAKPMAAGVILFAAGLLAAGSAQSMLALVIGRFVQGLGGGAINVAINVAVAHVFAEDERARIMTWFSVCWVMPAFVGPPVSAWISGHLSWHWVFWSVLPLLGTSAALGFRPLVRLNRHHHPHPDAGARQVALWVAAAVAVGAVVTQAGVQRLGTHGVDVLGVGGSLAGLGLLVLSVPRLMPAGFGRLRAGLPAVVVSRGCQAGAFFASESFLPLCLVELRHLSLFEAGLALTIGSLGWTVGSWLQSRPWLRLRRDQIILGGAVCTLAGVSMIVVFARHPGWSLALPALGWTLAGLGMGLSVASQSLAVMTLSKPAELGRNTSSLQVAEGLGNALAAGVAGAIFAALHSQHPGSVTFSWLFASAAVVALAATAVAGRIGSVRNATSGVG